MKHTIDEALYTYWNATPGVYLPKPKINNEPTIDHGVPLPIKSPNGSSIHLLKKLEVGDSVFLDMHHHDVYQRYYNPAKRLGMKVIIRKEGRLDGSFGSRLWRSK